MKMPDKCTNIQEIRTEIDEIDRQVIASFAKRFAYVKAASKFKTDATSVRAKERFVAMLEQRRIWAQEDGLNPDVIEKIYRDLITYFIEEELNHWQSNQ